MGRVIKGGAGGAQRGPPPRPPTRVAVDTGRRVIARDIYQAKQEAEELLHKAEQERARMLEQGKRQASQVREEAMSRGAADAFAQAASEALMAFRRRSERYAEAADDIRFLAREVARKVLGTDPDLSAHDVERILQQGMAQLRARRRLRVQVPEARLKELGAERPNLMRVLKDEPDLVIEAASDVGDGFARIVTEVGGALCAEETALNSLADAVNVHEQPIIRSHTGRHARFEHRTADADGNSRNSQVDAEDAEEVEDLDDDEQELDAEVDDEEGDESVEEDEDLDGSHPYPAAAGPDDETETFGLDRAQLRAIIGKRKGQVDDDGEVFRSDPTKAQRLASRPSSAEDPNATMSIALADVQAAEPSLGFSDLPDLPVLPVDDDELELFTDVAVPAPTPPPKKKAP
jgi:flagellar biosynthesis/type III secretory pathway protein FliH